MKKLAIKKRHIFLTICAGLFFFGANMCDTEEYTGNDDKEELEHIHTTNDSLIDAVDDIVKKHNREREEEKDSLINILESNKDLSQKEIDELNRLIKKKTLEVVVADSMEIVNVITRDTIIYNNILRDTIIYEPLIEEYVVIDTVYQIDTIIYTKDQIKKIKLKKD